MLSLGIILGEEQNTTIQPMHGGCSDERELEKLNSIFTGFEKYLRKVLSDS